MPTYHSPSSSPSRSPSRSSFTRSRSRPRRLRSPSPSSSLSRTPSPSRSRSRSRSRSPVRKSSTVKQLRDKFPDDGLSEEKSESIVKTSLVFLGAVGAATFAAHKFWPKGVTYGEKEEWECIKEEKVKRRARDAADGARRGGGAAIRAGVAGAGVGYAASSSSGGSSRGERDERRDRGDRRDRDDRRGAASRFDDRGAPSRGGPPAYIAREEVVVRDTVAVPDTSRSRSRLRTEEIIPYRGPVVDDRLQVTGPAVVIDRRAGTRREADYYPPAPQRSRDRSRGVARYDDYEDEAKEVVYVRREPVVGVVGGPRYVVGGPADARPRSRYGDDHYR